MLTQVLTGLSTGHAPYLSTSDQMVAAVLPAGSHIEAAPSLGKRDMGHPGSQLSHLLCRGLPSYDCVCGGLRPPCSPRASPVLPLRLSVASGRKWSPAFTWQRVKPSWARVSELALCPGGGCWYECVLMGVQPFQGSTHP